MAADVAAAADAVVQQVAPEQLLDLLPGWIQTPFLPCPVLPELLRRLLLKPALPGVKAVRAVAAAVAAGAVPPHLRDRNLQQVACSF